MENNEARTLVENIVFIVKEMLSKASFDKTETARIVEVQSGNRYKIMINNVSYGNIRTLNGDTFQVNETVKIMIPQSNYNQMFILGKLG